MTPSTPPKSHMPPEPERDPITGSSLTPIWLAPQRALRKHSPQEWQRVLFYAVGAVIGISFLMLFARQMNPPDAALLNVDLAKVLGSWDGSWRGTESSYSADGRLLARYPIVRDYDSTAWNRQSVHIFREGAPNPSEAWYAKVDQDGELTATVGSTDGGASYEGSYEVGVLVWRRTLPEGKEVIRTWIASNVLYYEATFFAASNPSHGHMVSARLERDS